MGKWFDPERRLRDVMVTGVAMRHPFLVTLYRTILFTILAFLTLIALMILKWQLGWSWSATENVGQALLSAFVLFGVYVAIRSALEPDPIHEPIYPAETVPPFEPRPAPADGNWQGWLERGIRIGQFVTAGAKLEGCAWFPVIDTHTLCAGESRMGKSKFGSNYMNELKPAIDAGAAEMILFDPSRGMEFSWAVPAGLVKENNFYWGEGEEHLSCYEEAFLAPMRHLVRQMNHEADLLRSVAQTHTATPETPHRFVLIDEGSRLTGEHVPRPIRLELTGLIMTMCNVGAKCGYTVIVLTQYPAIDEIKFRRGLLTGISLRVKSPVVTEMVGLDPEKIRSWTLPRHIKGLVYTTEHGGRMIRLCNGVPVKVSVDPEPSGRVPLPWDRDGDGIPDDVDPVTGEVSNVYPMYPGQAA